MKRHPSFGHEHPLYKKVGNFLFGYPNDFSEVHEPSNSSHMAPVTRGRRRRFRRRRGKSFGRRFASKAKFSRMNAKVGIKGKNKRGFLPRYRQINFVSNKFLGLKQLNRCIESKCFLLNFDSPAGGYTNGIGINNGNTLCFMPMTNMICQERFSDRSFAFAAPAPIVSVGAAAGGNAYAWNAAGAPNVLRPSEAFQSDRMWLTGIKLEMKIICATPEDFYFRMMIFKVHDPDMENLNPMVQDPPAGNPPATDGQSSYSWAQIPVASQINVTDFSSTNADRGASVFQFLDAPYFPGIPSDCMNADLLRPNPGYPGKLLYDKKWKVRSTSSGVLGTNFEGSPSYDVSVYLPCNQIWTWLTPGGTSTSLDYIPNFGKNGDFMYVLYYANASAIAGLPQQPIYLNGQFRIYFKDP